MAGLEDDSKATVTSFQVGLTALQLYKYVRNQLFASNFDFD